MLLNYLDFCESIYLNLTVLLQDYHSQCGQLLFLKQLQHPIHLLKFSYKF